MSILSKIFPILLTLCFFLGCRKFEQEKIVANAVPYTASNLYPIERLPSYFNRVAVLPVYHQDPDSTLLSFVDEIFQQELLQERIFEVIPISRETMKIQFGKEMVSKYNSTNIVLNKVKLPKAFKSKEVLGNVKAEAIENNADREIELVKVNLEKKPLKCVKKEPLCVEVATTYSAGGNYKRHMALTKVMV